MRGKIEIAIVDWDDACSDRGPIRPEEMNARFRCRSVGMILRIDKDYLTIAQDHILTDGRYRDVMHIPRDMIVRLKTVKG